MKFNFNTIGEQLVSSKNIVITSHQSPDGDAIGSSVSLYHYLIAKGHNPIMIIPDAIPPFLKWMDGMEDILVFDANPEEGTKVIQEADLIFSLDYNDTKRVGAALGPLLDESNAYKVMIDHHLDPSDFADWMMSDTSVCSTAQLIYEFITGLGDEELIDAKIGEGIYTGLVTDSGSFRFPSVDARTHEISADLIKKGLVHNQVHENLFDVNSMNRLKLLGFALSEKLHVLPNIPVAVIYISKEELDQLDNQKGSTEGLVNFALSVEGVQMAAFLKGDLGKVKMSFRSKGDVPVNEFSAANFSGGGHKNAAGGVCFESFEKTIEIFEKAVYEFWDKK